MRSRVLPCFAFVLCTAAAACSGAAPSDLLTGNGGGGGGGTEAGQDAAAADSSPILEQDSTTGEDTFVPPMDSGTIPGDTGTAGDAVQPTEGGPGPVRVLCPMKGLPATCDPGQYCCVTGSPNAGSQVDTCQASGTHCSGTNVSCAGAQDCPTGDVCCGNETQQGGNTYYTDVSCTITCSGAGKVYFCDPSNPRCPNGTSCTQSMILQGFYVCR